MSAPEILEFVMNVPNIRPKKENHNNYIKSSLNIIPPQFCLLVSGHLILNHWTFCRGWILEDISSVQKVISGYVITAISVSWQNLCLSGHTLAIPRSGWGFSSHDSSHNLGWGGGSHKPPGPPLLTCYLPACASTGVIHPRAQHQSLHSLDHSCLQETPTEWCSMSAPLGDRVDDCWGNSEEISHKMVVVEVEEWLCMQQFMEDINISKSTKV